MHDKEKNLIMNFRYWRIKWLVMYDLEGELDALETSR
jgi:hypothetical protein